MSLPQLLADVTASAETTAQATTPTDPISFQTALLVVIAGALIFLAKNLANLNRRLASLEASPNPAKLRASHAKAPPAAESTNGVTAEVIAAITAAVHTTIKGPARILSVGPICPNRQAWSAEGRRQVFSSHKVR